MVPRFRAAGSGLRGGDIGFKAIVADKKLHS